MQKDINRKSYIVSIENNNETRKDFDDAIERIIKFEQAKGLIQTK